MCEGSMAVKTARKSSVIYAMHKVACIYTVHTQRAHHCLHFHRTSLIQDLAASAATNYQRRRNHGYCQERHCLNRGQLRHCRFKVNGLYERIRANRSDQAISYLQFFHPILKAYWLECDWSVGDEGSKSFAIIHWRTVCRQTPNPTEHNWQLPRVDNSPRSVAAECGGGQGACLHYFHSDLSRPNQRMRSMKAYTHFRCFEASLEARDLEKERRSDVIRRFRLFYFRTSACGSTCRCKQSPSWFGEPQTDTPFATTHDLLAARICSRLLSYLCTRFVDIDMVRPIPEQ